MYVISEMSRSLFWGCIAIIILNVIMIHFLYDEIFLLCEIPFLIVMAIIFLSRKKRYEQYRIRMVVRMFLIYNQHEVK